MTVRNDNKINRSDVGKINVQLYIDLAQLIIITSKQSKVSHLNRACLESEVNETKLVNLFPITITSFLSNKEALLKIICFLLE